jgi:hypothetical protein
MQSKLTTINVKAGTESWLFPPNSNEPARGTAASTCFSSLASSFAAYGDAGGLSGFLIVNDWP